MTGAGILNFICGTASQLGHADVNPNDTHFRALVLQYLDNVIKDIQSRQESFHWRWLETIGATFNTVADTFSYTLTGIAADIDDTKVMAVYDKTTDTTYKYVEYSLFKRLIADKTNNSGDARYWSVAGKKLLLYPVPDSVVATYVDYVKVMSDAADSATALDIPDKYKNTVIAGVMKFVYKFNPELGNSAGEEQSYESGIQRMIQDNAVLIADISQPISHRQRRHISNVDHKHSIYFPLGNDSI